MFTRFRLFSSHCGFNNLATKYMGMLILSHMDWNKMCVEASQKLGMASNVTVLNPQVDLMITSVSPNDSLIILVGINKTAHKDI